MSTRSQATRVLPRVERRRAEARERIVVAAARQFAAAGPEAVRMDQVAEAADVARGTLYSHFPTKDDLLCAIVEPVLELAARRAAGLARFGAREGVDGLLALYLELWRTYPDALRIAYRAQDIPVGNVGAAAPPVPEGRDAGVRAGEPGGPSAGRAIRHWPGTSCGRWRSRCWNSTPASAEWEALFVNSVRGLLTSGDWMLTNGEALTTGD